MELMRSALEGVVLKLRNGEPLEDSAVREIARLLLVLRDEGWSGSVPADEAALALARDAAVRALRRARRIEEAIRDAADSDEAFEAVREILEEGA